jgi:uncharacterized cofD-like protein
MGRYLLIFTLGSLLLFCGAALSFKQILVPIMETASGSLRSVLLAGMARERIEVAVHIAGGVALLFGAWAVYWGGRGVASSILRAIAPGSSTGFTDIYLRRQQLAHGPRIVALGGGTGLSTLLRGLKQHSSNITAIVTVTDDGGSSGRLTQEKGMIPPGDIRNCLVALSDAEKAMTSLFQHRFKNDSGSLSGHSMGNLLIAALVDQAKGDFERAVEIASDVLAIRGRVLPSATEHVRLRAVMDDGVEICGETAIVQYRHRIASLHLDPPDCKAHQSALDAIRNADLICIGPGSVYTSVIPNLLVPEIAKALLESDAPKVYICNVMTQPGESDAFTAAEHVNAILSSVHGRVFDTVLINTGIPTESALAKYRVSGQHLVEADHDRVRAMGLRVLLGNYMSETDVVRHDPFKVATRLMGLVDA